MRGAQNIEEVTRVIRWCNWTFMYVGMRCLGCCECECRNSSFVCVWNSNGVAVSVLVFLRNLRIINFRLTDPAIYYVLVVLVHSVSSCVCTHTHYSLREMRRVSVGNQKNLRGCDKNMRRKRAWRVLVVSSHFVDIVCLHYNLLWVRPPAKRLLIGVLLTPVLTLFC